MRYLSLFLLFLASLSAFAKDRPSYVYENAVLDGWRTVTIGSPLRLRRGKGKEPVVLPQMLFHLAEATAVRALQTYIGRLRGDLRPGETVSPVRDRPAAARRIALMGKTSGGGKPCPSCWNRQGGHYFIDWVVVGGESGLSARPCDVEWIRSIVLQCKAADVPCFVKQLGSAPGINERDADKYGVFSFHYFDESSRIFVKRMNDRKGGDPSEWPKDVRVRKFPEVSL